MAPTAFSSLEMLLYILVKIGRYVGTNSNKVELLLRAEMRIHVSGTKQFDLHLYTRT